MIVSSAELASLIREIEAEDPIDYATLPYAEDDLRLLVCGQMRDLAVQAERLGEESCQTMLLAVAAKLVLENLVLHVRLLQAQGQGQGPQESAAALFRRLRGRED